MQGLPDAIDGTMAPPPSPEPMKVYLRLRPRNKLETMKRGKDCIELHEDPKRITVDSPRLGEHEFSFDQVFDEFSSQEEVYRESISAIPPRLVRGVNTTILAYGQSGSGKTHTLLGEGLGVELNTLAAGPQSTEYGSTTRDPRERTSNSSMTEDQYGMTTANHLHRKKLDPKQHPNVTAGMIPRAIAHIFDLLYESTSSDSSVEFTIRCSYVEIYLDRITDLLQPAREENAIRVGRTSYGGSEDEACIVGATELCCVCPEDVYAVLARGQALRTKAANDASVDSSRSHAIFTLRLEKTDKATGELSRSRMQVFDLAGSQGTPNPKAAATSDSATDAERSMVNASLASIHRIVRTTLKHQKHQRNMGQVSYSQPSVSFPLSKVAKILQPSIGGNTYTTMICTGSPSSYSIDETIQTISFAQMMQKIYNMPRGAFQGYTLQGYQMQLSLTQQRQHQMSKFIRLLAQECKHGKKKSREPKNQKVWDAVLQIVEADKARKEKMANASGNEIAADYDGLCISVFEEGEKEKEIRDLRARLASAENKLRQECAAREKFESAYRDATSELVALKSQRESFGKHKRKLEEKLLMAKAKNKEMSATKTDLEHKLRTSQFRENESILFLRQFRTFYFRLLRNKAAHGSGNTREVMEEAKNKIPGTAPDLEDLLDVDKMMVKSGIIESSEIGADTPTSDYSPSKSALTKSSREAKAAEEREMALIEDEMAEEFGPSKGLTRGQLIACRQKLLLSPSGLLAIEKEKEVEKTLLQLSEKCMGLQNSLSAEKSMVQALSGRQGAMTKMKQIQDTIMLKTELERRTNDLLAIVWKMNELHLVNKTLSSKAATREQYSSYLSDYLSEIQAKNQRRVAQVQSEGSRLREENSDLRNQLDAVSLGLWQLGEQLEKAPLWRCSVSFSGEHHNSTEEIPDCRLSSGKLTEEEIDGLIEVVQCNE